MDKKLYRSNINKTLCDVYGGIGEYFNIDPTIVRLIWATFVCFGPGIIAYFVATIIIPLAPNQGRESTSSGNRSHADA